MDKRRKAILAGLGLALVGSAILGTGLVKATIDKDGWDSNGSPGMVLVVLFGVWAISTMVRAIKR